jgi:hypothetical protein
MPIFALANAGVAISGGDIGQPVSAAIVAGLVFGKPAGVMAFTWLAVRLGIATRAVGLSWPLLVAGSLLTGIGFTMSLFIANLAYAPAMLNAAKIGVLTASAISAVAGLLILIWLTFREAQRVNIKSLSPRSPLAKIPTVPGRRCGARHGARQPRPSTPKLTRSQPRPSALHRKVCGRSYLPFGAV